VSDSISFVENDDLCILLSYSAITIYLFTLRGDETVILVKWKYDKKTEILHRNGILMGKLKVVIMKWNIIGRFALKIDKY